MTSHTYRVVCPCRATSVDARTLNAALADAGSVHAQQELLGTWYERRDDQERLTFFVSASDLAEAVSRVRAVASEVVQMVEARLGRGSLALADGELTSRPEVLASGVLGSDLDGVADRMDACANRGIERPFVQVIRRVRVAVGDELPEGESVRIRLGRVWTPCEPRPEGTAAWRVRPGREAGLPRTSELATLAGARFAVPRQGVVERTATLQERCRGTGWTAVYLGGAIEEWLGRRGFCVTYRHSPDESSLAFLPVPDPVDLLWFRGTSGASVGLGTEELVGRLRAWRPRCDMAVVSVTENEVALHFREVPNDLGAFTAEMLALCPDATAADDGGRPLRLRSPQGGRTSFQALGEALSRTHTLHLRWD